MPFRPEPKHQHGTIAKSAIVLVNLGTPDAPTRPAVRRYLKQFLSDPRVVEIPRAVWNLILHLAILPFRSGQSAKKYATIWGREGSPLKVYTERQAAALHTVLAQRGHRDVEVAMAMRYGSPALPDVLDDLKARGVERIVVLPAYPQYSGTTTASIWDAVFDHYKKVRNIPELRLVKHYHDHEGYIEALAASVEAHWEAHGRGEKLLMSFHGVPKRTLLLGDPYHCECHRTARLLAARQRVGRVVAFDGVPHAVVSSDGADRIEDRHAGIAATGRSGSPAPRWTADGSARTLGPSFRGRQRRSLAAPGADSTRLSTLLSSAARRCEPRARGRARSTVRSSPTSPSSIRITRSATATASLTSWVTSSTVNPC